MTAGRIPWQEKLQEQCRALHLPPPVYKEYSDRRGGRTAWSCSVHIGQGLYEKATYFYDGKCVDNAKDDAAENMLRRLKSVTETAPMQSTLALFQQQQHQQQQQQQLQQQHHHHHHHHHQQAIKLEQVRW